MSSSFLWTDKTRREKNFAIRRESRKLWKKLAQSAANTHLAQRSIAWERVSVISKKNFIEINMLCYCLGVGSDDDVAVHDTNCVGLMKLSLNCLSFLWIIWKSYLKLINTSRYLVFSIARHTCRFGTSNYSQLLQMWFNVTYCMSRLWVIVKIGKKFRLKNLKRRWGRETSVVLWVRDDFAIVMWEKIIEIE